MPNLTIEQFKTQRTAQLAATLCVCNGKDGEEGQIFKELKKGLNSYKRKFTDWINRRERVIDEDNYDEDEMNAIKAAKKALKILESIDDLVGRYPKLKLPMQQRDLIIDVKKLFDEYQEQLEIMEMDNNYTDVFKDAEFGSKDYIEYITEKKITLPGINMLLSEVFDHKNIAVVNDFNRSYNDPTYHKDDNNADIKSYFFLYKGNFNDFLERRNLKNSEIIFEVKKDGFDPLNAFVKDEMNVNYALMPDYINSKQMVVKRNIIDAFQEGQNDLTGNSIYAELTRFRNTIEDLHKQINSGRYANAEPKVKNAMLHLDQILWGKINENPDNGLLRKINHFLNNTTGVDVLHVEDDDVNKLVTSDRGFTGILRSLKSIQEDAQALPTFKNLCSDIQKKLEGVMERTLNDAVNNNEYNKYIIRNSGDFIINKDKDLANSVAKVTAAYEWKKKTMTIPNEADRPAFDPAKIDASAKELMTNPLFRARYMGEGEAWNNEALKNASTKHEEWRVNNRIDKPLSYDSMADKKRDALKDLQELGKIIGSAEGASEGYQNFNRTLKELGNIDISKVPSEQLGDMLDKIFKVTESYMKGRKSKRWTDSQQEHFDQTLDVLAIISKTGKNGQELAKKLVDRTNYVRTHRWHHLYDQETVTLEGRSNEATKARIQGVKANKNTNKNIEAPKL